MMGRELARPKLNSRISSSLNIEPLPQCPNIHMEVIGTVILLQVGEKYSIPRGLGTKVQQKKKKERKRKSSPFNILSLYSSANASAQVAHSWTEIPNTGADGLWMIFPITHLY